MPPEAQDLAAEMRRIATEEERALERPPGEEPIGEKAVSQALLDNEIGDARLLARLLKGRWVFDHSQQQWLFWAGQYWQRDEVACHMREIEHLVAVYRQETLRLTDEICKASGDEQKRLEAKRKDLYGRINKLQTVSRVKKVLELARSGYESLGITGREWDLDPYCLPCVNGVVDLVTGVLRQGRPEDYVRTVCPTQWKSLDEPCPNWDKFLDDIFDGDQDMIGYVQRLFGYSVAGLTVEHMLPILQGQGRNGKGTMLETLKHVLGPLAGPIQAEMLIDHKYADRSASAASPEVLGLRGKRLTWASELNEGAVLNSSKVKWLTGGDTLKARPLYGSEEIEFRPTHTLFLLTNPKPRAGGDDYALWQRLHLIKFKYSFVDDPVAENERPKDKELPDRLKAESSGILAWLVRGFRAWQEHGIAPPDQVRAATQDYQSEEDVLGQFIEECCIVGDGYHVSASPLYEAYLKWAETKHMRNTLSNAKFGRKMGERFEKDKAGTVYYRGITLRVGE